ncbi:MAG: efflux transporter outer membrane subunit [Proteobacteria bacterium]|nr:efflux transporter outer membrane subunit [Pseudomonadota bacterium]MBU1058887.1 efflux transporter outer membrane subunit [Pseudomonadota bacterium]
MNQSWHGRNKQKKRVSWSTLARALSAASLIQLAGCAAVGPEYVSPESTVSAAWHTELKQGGTGKTLDSQQLVHWWTQFDDPVLSSLIQGAVTSNLDLKQATAKLREARARRGVSQAGQFPTVDGSGAMSRSKSSENSGGGGTHSSYSVAFDAGWEVDIFGGKRRAVEAAEADLAASQEDLRDVLVTLTAEVALNYLDVRSLQKRLGVAEENLVIQEQTFALVQARCQAGISNELALQQARYNLESTRAQIPVLRSGLDEAQNRLAVLIGTVPGGVHQLLAERRPIPFASPLVAVGVPAETLRRRPDIRRAERNLAAQTARVGVATADLYPTFRLAGSIGLEALKSAELFEAASKTWGIGPSVSWNIFDAGAIRQNIEVQSAIQEQYFFIYEGAVLAALEEVENALTAYAQEQLRRERLFAAAAAASQAETLARNQYQAGLIDFTAILDAQQALLSFADQQAESDGAVTSNLIRLYKALGGGWDSLASSQFSEKDARQ